MKVSVRELKNHLSQYLHQVKAGVTILVTSHQVPLAVIQAVPKPHKPGLEKLYHLEHISWNGKKPKGLRNPPKIKGKLASEMILEDRG
jgi:prevent-host-death family protein